MSAYNRRDRVREYTQAKLVPYGCKSPIYAGIAVAHVSAGISGPCIVSDIGRIFKFDAILLPITLALSSYKRAI